MEQEFMPPDMDESLRKELQDLSNEVERQLNQGQQAAHPAACADAQPQSKLASHPQQQEQQQQQPQSAPGTKSPLPKASSNAPSLPASALSPRARNPKLVGRHVPPYSAAKAAAAEAARNSMGPQNTQTNALLDLGGPGPLGSPLAKLMQKYTKGPIAADTVPEQDIMLHTKKQHKDPSLLTPKTKPPSKDKWAEPREAGASTARQAHLQQQQPGGAAKLASTLPGQWQFREIQARAAHDSLTRPRGFANTNGGAGFTFQKEMDGLNCEIDEFLRRERFVRAAPGAATVLQASWRARGPRLMFAEFQRQHRRAASTNLRAYFDHFRQLVGVIRYWRQGLMATCFYEWQQMGALKMELYRKVLLKLKASMIDVRDSQSPSRLWRLCMVEGQDPWVAHISLGALCRNLIIGQAPRRKLVSYFCAWRERLHFKVQMRQQAADVLRQMQARHDRGRMLMLLRFWFRWSVVRQSERMGLSPPLFRPPMLVWDAWLSNHHRSKHLETRIPKLHWDFHVRRCFQFWHFYTTRNKRMRLAFMASAAYQIEIVLRQCVNGLKANWQEARLYRRMRKAVLREWSRLAQRNVQVRAIAAKVHVVSARTYLKQSFRMLREWASMSSMLAASGCIQMWQRRTLCLIPMFAWTGDNEHMWFCSAWNAWRNLVLGRLRFRCMVGMHIERQGLMGKPAMGMDMELWFRAWAKAAKTQARLRAQVAKFHRMHHRKQLREALRQQSIGREDLKAFRRSTSRVSGSSSQAGNLPRERQGSFAGSRQGSLGRLSTRTSMTRTSVIESSTDEEELTWMEPGARVCAAEDFELQDRSVEVVNLSDLPRVSPYRPLHTRSFILATTAPKPTAWSALRDHIKQLASDLKGVDGRFRPGLVYMQQFLFEHLGAKADALEPAVQRFLSTGREESMKNWGSGRIVGSPNTADRKKPVAAALSSMPTALDGSDPWLWQRMVGLMACSIQPHSETPLNNLANVGFLPFAEEVGAMKRLQYRDRMRLPIVDEEMTGDDEEVFRPRGHRRSGEFLRAHHREAKPEKVVSWDGVLEPDARGLMWMYKLAEAEEVLETSIAWLMKLNAKDLPILYQVLVNQRAPSLGPNTVHKLTFHDREFKTLSTRASSGSATETSDAPPPEYKLPDKLSCCKQGDLLAWVIKGAIRNDSQASHRALSHVLNRDRVITTSSSLGVYAQALNSHCPEFTLTNPLTSGMRTWLDVVARVDNEGKEPNPNRAEARASSPTQPNLAREASNGSPKGRKRGKRQGSAADFHERGRILMNNKGPSKADLIRMEMEGTLPSLAGKLSTIAESKSQDGGLSEPGTARGRSISGQLDNTSRLASSPGPWAGTAKQGLKGRGDSLHSTMSNQSRQSKTVNQAYWRPTGVQKSPIQTPPIWRSISRKFTGSPSKLGSTGPMKSGQANDGRHNSSLALPDSPVSGSQATSTGHLPVWEGLTNGWDARSNLAGEMGSITTRTSTYGGAENGRTSPLGHQAQGWEGEGQGSNYGQGKQAQMQPYVWFAGPGRIFECVTDVEVPEEPPSMHELHHRANRVAEQNLAINVFTAPLMPAIVFQAWGNPIPVDLTDDLAGQQGAAGDAYQEQPGDGPPPTLHSKKDSDPPEAVAGPWGAIGDESARRKMHSQASYASKSSTGSGTQLTAEQKQKLEEMQDQGDVTDMETALRMAQEDAAEAVLRDQAVTGGLRKGLGGYIESHVLPNSSAGSSLLTRTRVSGDGSSEEDVAPSEKVRQVEHAALKLQKEEEDGSALASLSQLLAPGAQAHGALDSGAASEARTQGQPGETQKAGSGVGPEVATLPATSPGQAACEDPSMLQAQPSQTGGQDSGMVQAEQGSGEGAAGKPGRGKGGDVQGGTGGEAEPVLTARKSVFWQAFHEAQSEVAEKGVDGVQQQEQEQEQAAEEGYQQGHRQRDEQVLGASKEASVPGTTFEYRRRPPVRRPTFVATPHELRIFLGGHMTRTRTVSRERQQAQTPSSAAAAAGENTAPAPRTGISGISDRQRGGRLVVGTEQEELQGQWSPIHGGSREAFEAVFDPSRVVRSDSQRRAQLLDGYDLRNELRELLQEGQEEGPGSQIRAGDGDYSALALAGAEAVLFGHRNLSVEEERAVRAELERLERELPKIPRQYPNLPVGVSDPSLPTSARKRRSQISSPRRQPHSPDKTPSPRKESSGLLGPLAGGASAPRSPSSPERWQQEQPPLLQEEKLQGEDGFEGKSSFSKMMQHLKQQAALEAEPGRQQPPLSAEGRSPVQLPPQTMPVSPGEVQMQQLHPNKGVARSTAIEDASVIFPERPSTIDSMTQGVYPESVASSGLAVAGLEDQYNRQEEAFPISPWSPKGLDSAGSMEGQAAHSGVGLSGRTPSPDASNAMGAMFARRSNHVRPCRRGNLRSLPIPPPPPGILPSAQNTPASASPSELPSIQEAQGSDASASRISSRPGSAPLERPAHSQGPLRASHSHGSGAVQQELPADMQVHGPFDLQVVLPNNNEDDDGRVAAAAEQEALRAMWCAAPYSQQGAGQGGAAAAAEAMTSLIGHAAEDEWLQYEEGAMQLIEQLTSALAKHNSEAQPGVSDSVAAAAATPGPAAWGSPHNTTAPPTGTLSRQLSSAGLPSGSSRGARALGGPHTLMQGLNVLEQNVAAAIEPNALTGLSLGHYNEGLMDLIARLVVSPMATKYLFWKKVQSVAQLKQRVMEDRALEQQLQDIAWGATFTPGFAPVPTGALPPAQAALHATLQPHRSVGGPQPLAPITQGWSPGALSVLTAPKAAWLDEIGATRFAQPPQQEVRDLCSPLRLHPRDDTPRAPATHKQRSKSAHAKASAEVCSSMHPPGSASPMQQQVQQQQEEEEAGIASEVGHPPAPPAPMSIMSMGRAGNQQQQQQQQQQELKQQFFPPKGNELLAERLMALLEARRGLRRNKAPLNSLYVDVAALEQDEAEVSRMAAYTIALNKDKLAALHARKQLGGGAGPAGKGGHPGMVPGKGMMLGSMCTEGNGGSWMHAGPNPKSAAHAYNGRDMHQDTSNPFYYPTRVRPARQAHVSARGARPMEVATSARDAPLVVTGLAGSSGRVEQPGQGVFPSQTTAQQGRTSLSISSAALEQGQAVGPLKGSDTLASLTSASRGDQGAHASRLDRLTSQTSSSARRACVVIDPTSKVDVVAPLPDPSKPQAAGVAVGGGSHHLPMPSGQQRPVRGRHGAGGNAAPLGSLQGLSPINAARFVPRGEQDTVQQQLQQQEQQRRRRQGEVQQPLLQHEQQMAQPPLLQHGQEEAQPPLLQQPSLPGLSSGVHDNLQAGEHFLPVHAHESTAIAGLEHCYRGGPTPLGPGRVGNGQGGKPGGLAVPRTQASPLGWGGAW